MHPNSGLIFIICWGQPGLCLACNYNDMNKRRYVLFAAAAAVLFLLLWLVWPVRWKNDAAATGSGGANYVPLSADAGGSADAEITTVYAHNLELRKGPDFRIYVRWLRGQMVPTEKGRTPSLDDERSFTFHVDRGLVHANLGDIDTYLNAKLASRSPLKSMKVRGEGDRVKISGMLHKLLVPLPVEVEGTLSPASNERVHFAITKINVLKMPVKGLLGGFKVDAADIMGKTPMDGVEMKGNDIYFDTTKLLPPPHVRGQISRIELKLPDLVVTFGPTTPEDEQELAKWHNFLRLRGGTVAFGKVVMSKADLTLIDASDDRWFDLDLANYRQQMVKGYSRMTPQDGIEMFMPDVGKGMPAGSLSLDTLRDRNKPLPDPKTMK